MTGQPAGELEALEVCVMLSLWDVSIAEGREVCVEGWGCEGVLYVVVLQEEAAVALCGFLSVPLTYKTKEAMR